MTTLSPQMLISGAGVLCQIREHGICPAPLVRHFVQGVGRARARRWDAAFVHHAGYWSHYDNRSGTSSWPLPATTIANDLGIFARKHRVLSDGGPQPGEIFVLYSPSRAAFVHTGIVVGVEPPTERFDGALEYQCHTIEGNVTATGRPDGPLMGRGARILSPAFGDRTIRWADLEPYETTTRQKVTDRMSVLAQDQLLRAA